MRRRFKTLRARVSADEARAAALKIADATLGFLNALGLTPECAPVALYASLPGELDALPLLRRLAEHQYPTLLPVAAEKATPLTFRLWRPGDALVAGRFGLREPAPDAPEIVPGIVFAPLLAFDANGGRLGFGGGFYDVTLSGLRARGKLLAAGGLAFALQEAAEIPMEKHDARLDFVVTEQQILTFTETSCDFSSSAT
jgi:5-formyltetrahydrofolate cyclo-ligase